MGDLLTESQKVQCEDDVSKQDGEDDDDQDTQEAEVEAPDGGASFYSEWMPDGVEHWFSNIVFHGSKPLLGVILLLGRKGDSSQFPFIVLNHSIKLNHKVGNKHVRFEM